MSHAPQAKTGKSPWRHLAGVSLALLTSSLSLGWQRQECGTKDLKNALTGDYTTLMRVQVTPASQRSQVDRVTVEFLGDPTGAARSVAFDGASDVVAIPVATYKDDRTTSYRVRLLDRCGNEISSTIQAAGLLPINSDKDISGPDLLTVTLAVPEGYVPTCASAAASPTASAGSPSPLPVASGGSVSPPPPSPSVSAVATPTPTPAPPIPVGQMFPTAKRTRYTVNQSADAEVSIVFYDSPGDAGIRWSTDDFRNQAYQVDWQLRDAATEAVLKSGRAPVTVVPLVVQATVMTPTVPSTGIKAYWKVTLTTPGGTPLQAQTKSFVLADPPAP